MTTITLRDNVVASDRRTSNFHCMPCTKVHRLRDGSVIGFAGSAELLHPVIDYLNGGGPKPQIESDKSATYLRAYADGRAEKVWNLGGIQPIPPGYFAAIGSGADYAMGAMDRGATAFEAVETASRYDEYSGGGVDWLVPRSEMDEAELDWGKP